MPVPNYSNPNNPTLQTSGPTSSGLSDMLGMSAQTQVNAAPGSLYTWNGPSAGMMADQAKQAMGQSAAQVNLGAGGQYLNGNGMAEQQRRQTALEDQLIAQANGQGTSAAQAQLQAGADKAMAQQLSMAHSARGPGASLAGYNASQMGAKTMADTNQQAAVLRAQEAAQARGELGNVLNQQQGANLSAAQQQQQLAMYQANLQQQQNALGNQTALGYYGLGNQAAGGQLQGGIAQGQNYLGAQGLNVQESLANAGAGGSASGGLMSTAGTAIGAMALMSDINAKQGVQPAGNNPQPMAQDYSQPGLGMSLGQGGTQYSAPSLPSRTAGSQPSSPQFGMVAPQAQRPAAPSYASPLMQAGPPTAGMVQPAMSITSDPATKQGFAPAGDNNDALEKQVEQDPMGAEKPVMPKLKSGAQDAFHGLDQGLSNLMAMYQAGQAQQGSQAGNMLSSMGQGATTGAINSDRRMKDPVPGGHTVGDSFLDALTKSQSTYTYKDPNNEPTDRPTGGRYLGIMAQAVKDTPTGDTIVKDGPKGEYLEMGPSLSAALAGLGRLNERLQTVEDSLGAKSKKKAK